MSVRLMGFTHFCADLFRCGGSFIFLHWIIAEEQYHHCSVAQSCLSCFAADDLCQKPGHCSTALHTAWLVLLYEEVRQPGNPLLLQQGCPSTSTSSPKADLDVHSLQCLLWAWSPWAAEGCSCQCSLSTGFPQSSWKLIGNTSIRLLRDLD